MTLWTDAEDKQIRYWHVGLGVRPRTYAAMAAHLNKLHHKGQAVRNSGTVWARYRYVNCGRRGRPAADAVAGRPPVATAIKAKQLRALILDAGRVIDAQRIALRGAADLGNVPRALVGKMDKLADSVRLRLMLEALVLADDEDLKRSFNKVRRP